MLFLFLHILPFPEKPIDYSIDKLTKYRGNETASIKPLGLTNIPLLVLIIATCIAWHCGIVEKRNENIVQHDKTTVSEVES